MNNHRSLFLTGLLLSLATARAGQAGAGDIQTMANNIDARLEAAWGGTVKPAALADDAEFFRRVHLDLAGRIPSVTEIRDFLDDEQPDKRRRWVDRILRADPDDAAYKDAYVLHFANVWRHWLLAQTEQQNQAQPALEAWLQQRLRGNAGYDRLVRELLTQPVGGNAAPSPAVFYQANENKPENLAASTARLFLGVKLECAQCHDHPFDKWTRTQFWQYAAFFTDLTPQGRQGSGRGQLKIAGQDKMVRARFIDGQEPHWPAEAGTRPALAEWLTAPANPFFARAVVNRLWLYFFGSGLTERPEGTTEDIPASHRELLDDLARELAARQYDLKFLIRAIIASQAYQRTSAVSHPSHTETRLFARMPLRGLSPEQLFDSLAQATEYQGGVAADPQAFLLATQSARRQFLARFTAQENKTDYQTSILQALYFMNNEFIAERTSLAKNRTLATLAEQRTSTARKLESLYLAVLARKPRAPEGRRLVHYVETGGPSGEPHKALADVFWVLINSPEFILNH
jgi:hypothetical protein